MKPAVLMSLVLMAALAHGKPEADAVKDLVKGITDALKGNDAAAAEACFARAEELKATTDEKKFDPVVKAIGKATGHKDAAIASGAIGALGKLRVKGSTKMFAKLVTPPARVPEDRLGVHLAAIRASGEIQDADSTKALLKNLEHGTSEVAVASAEALSSFKGLEAKDRLGLLGDLIKELGKLEKKVAAAKQEEAKADADKVRSAVGAALHGLTGKEGVASAEDWDKWLKEEARKK